jgi:5-formyltetrahydrofolate cyclo-ligase
MVMDMVELHSMQDFESLARDKWGIPTPDVSEIASRRSTLGLTAAAFSPGLDLIVMPGVAFDSTLGRLGHGKGFYDFFLAQYALKYSNDLQAQGRRSPFLGTNPACLS